MLDTRIVGRDKQLDYANYIDSVTGAFETDNRHSAPIPNFTMN
jgi:hypothetical protein